MPVRDGKRFDAHTLWTQLARPSRLAPPSALLVLVCGIDACRKGTKDSATDTAPDAAASESAFHDKKLGLQLALLPSWVTSTQSTTPNAPRGAVKILEVRRKPAGTTPYLVPPRLSVTVEPTELESTDAFMRSTLEDLKRIEARGRSRLVRTALSSRVVNGENVGEIEASYEIPRPGSEHAVEVVHRSLVALRRNETGGQVGVAITATYLEGDQDLVAPEVQTMFRSLVLEPSPGGSEQ